MYALLADGSTAEIRSATPDDYAAVKAMHEGMSADNVYLRFFNMSRLAAETEARRLCHEPRPGHAALLALTGDQVAGCASYDGAAGSGKAEIAFAVADHMHHKGIATLLLEHLVAAARKDGISVLTAEVLGENTPMLRVFADAGLPVRRHLEEGVIEVTIPLPAGESDTALEAYLSAVSARERAADAASLRHMFAPESVAVIGASRTVGTVGRSILDNIRTGGYTGRLYPVNPRAHQVSGIHCVPTVQELPEVPDLAIVAVPAPAVTAIAEDCGKLGVKALVVVTSGLDTAASADLLAACRRYGMRLVGPNCFGIAVPGIGLDATFASRPPKPGSAGLVMQSGGLGFALVDHLTRLGIGISSFASVGNKLDVSGNDMLMWWEQDGVTRLALLYLESFGNPRKFARTARRIGLRMPVLTVHAGRSEIGQRAAASHTAAVASPLVSRQALFEQAGIIATPGWGELLEAAALLSAQPVPAGHTVAIVSNAGGAGVLAADACAEHGLDVYQPHGMTRRKLRALLPEGATVTGPIDTTAPVSGEQYRQCLELIAADPLVHAIISIVLPTAATGDLVAATAAAAKTTAAKTAGATTAGATVPIAAVHLCQAATVEMLDGGVPCYAYPEAAVGAIARAARYGAWRSEPRGVVPELPGVRAEDARTLVHDFLADAPSGGWLSPARTAELLRCYGIPFAPLTPVTSEDAAVQAFAEAGGPVVLKADVPGLVHKTDAGAVQLDLRSEAAVRAAYRYLTDRFGASAAVLGRSSALRHVLVQPMLSGGTEVIIGVADDHVFGPLVVFGLGGVATEVLADHAARLAPLTEADAETLISSVRSAPLLYGHRGTPAVDLAALRDVLLRVSRLSDDLPEIAELDLNPVIARPDGAVAVDARIRVAPQVSQDPFLRK